MPTVTAGTNEFPALVAFVGGFILVFGIISFFVKEKMFLSDSLVATLAGIAFGPIAIGLVDPFEWPGDVYTTLLQFSDLIINIQIMAAAITLPRKFWKSRWISLTILLGPVTIYMWLTTTLIFWYFLQVPVLLALIMAACTAPTDPVLANSIVNGRFADMHITKPVREILSGESAANDGVALPFFFLGVALLKYPPGKAMAYWFAEVWAYELGVALVTGLAVGYVARVTLRFSEERQLIDKKNFLSFEIALA
ncbi:hypothetical protein HK102_004397, partial [Quaeritorhiza haematococci]